MSAPAFWQRRGVLAGVAFPLAQLFGALARWRRKALCPQRLPVPVIVVGNIAVGGSGKTPVVDWLVGVLRARGWHPGIVSRGHGGRIEGVAAVPAEGDPALYGDEPVLLARLTGCPLVIGRDRPAAGSELLRLHPECDVIVADDGMQHYRLGRDLEIAVVDEATLGNRWLLPAGPLREPLSRLAVSAFSVENPRGFGLMQRTRDFGRYEDLDDRYELRPSGWVETRGDWGKGHVELVEIPTPDETNDNIVAFWSPEKQPEPGQSLDLEYRLHFSMDEPSLHDPELAWVQQTRISTGDVKQANLIRQPDGSTALVVDFVGPVLEKLAEDAPVSTRVSVDDNAELVENNLRYNTVTKGWRLTLRVKVRDPARPVEMRAALVDGDKTLSETWTYQIPPHE